MFAACPACGKRLYEYRDGRWTEQICWHCGHYSSNTPAFSAQPELFRDVVRKNGAFFMKKYAYYARCLT
ncbi:hypothetical protein [Nitrososphaera sp.]|uniref:hypothetical protein n=1 Tax=Nitrososphaera sp. TaxID=1971748 RepID=UPI001858BDFD|nr:hypothetical protein [Nitrososphaera sp.]NWG37265.1 hypothetical protein [Nitrososphaera sp.]